MTSQSRPEADRHISFLLELLPFEWAVGKEHVWFCELPYVEAGSRNMHAKKETYMPTKINVHAYRTILPLIPFRVYRCYTVISIVGIIITVSDIQYNTSTMLDALCCDVEERF